MDSSALHRDALTIATHNDTIAAHILRGNWSVAGSDSDAGDDEDAGGVNDYDFSTISFLRGAGPVGREAPDFQIDMTKMTEGGIDSGFFAVDVTTAFKNRLTYALDAFGFLFRNLDRTGTEVRIVRTSQDILDAKKQGVPGVILSIEHADCTERSINVLRMLYELGIRSIGLTHNVSSWAADGCLEARDGVGLTKYGVRLVREMNALGMLVDTAHASPSAFYHVLEISEKPVIFSHGNSRALCDHPRNLTDRQLKVLGEAGGVVGMSFVPMFVDAENPTLERLLDHFEHVVDVAGVECVGIGSDFDGGGTVLNDAEMYPLITSGLLERGYPEDAVRKILGENTLRVLRASIG